MGLDSVELVMEVEDRFRVKLEDERLERTLRVDQLAEYVWEQLQADPNPVPIGQRPEWTRSVEAVTDEVRRLTSRQLHIPIEDIKPASAFVRDLGMDR